MNNNELNTLIHSQEPLPNLAMVVDVGGDRYHMGSRHLNLGYNNYQDFIKTFGNDREVERILRQYLFLRVGAAGAIHFEGDTGEKDKAALIRILKKRLAQLKQNKNFTSSQLNKQKLQKIYMNIQAILMELGGAVVGESPLSEECKKDKEDAVLLSAKEDRVFQLMLELSWYLLHPDQVPKDIECDWAALIKKMDHLSTGDLVKSIIEEKDKKKIPLSNKPFNYFQKIHMDRMGKKETLTNALDEAKQMVLEVESEDADKKIKAMVPKLLQLLHTKKILNSATMSDLTDAELEKAEKRIIEPPFAGMNTRFHKEAASVEEVEAAEKKKKEESTVVVSAVEKPKQKKHKPGNIVIIEENTQKGGADPLTTSMYGAMEPLFAHFRIMYDPIYGMLEKGAAAINLTHPITLLHLCTQLQKTVSMKGAYSYGIYRIRKVPAPLMSFMKGQFKVTSNYLTSLQEPIKETTLKKQFEQQLFNLPKVRLSSLLSNSKNKSYKDQHGLPYLQFFVLGTNFSFPNTYTEFIHDKGIVEEEKTLVYDAMKKLFEIEDLYLVCTTAEDVGISSLDIDSSTKSIPMTNYEIEYSTVDTSKEALTISKPDNHFNEKNTTLFFEQLVKREPFLIYNDAELALSNLIAFKEHFPK